ncbi:hypothetical protein V6N11_081827 [Hibiscus sabdariffa]|uniref:Uncharacterized protein n=1 Tax=Hibiscus sabdariffa TaxID=183260 RepID=A0ABR2Q7U2_9ROSI
MELQEQVVVGTNTSAAVDTNQELSNVVSQNDESSTTHIPESNGTSDAAALDAVPPIIQDVVSSPVAVISQDVGDLTQPVSKGAVNQHHMVTRTHRKAIGSK